MSQPRPAPYQVRHRIESACPGWTAHHHTLTHTYSARMGWVEVHGRTADEVVARVREVTR